MKQKILFIGNRHFLSSILESLEASPFIQENKIDIIIAQPKALNKKTRRKLILSLKKLDFAFIMNKIINKFFIRLNLRFFKNQIESIKKYLFPERELDYLNELRNVRFLEYDGLNFKNLETYDFMIVASFSLKIPKVILETPRRGALNIHPSCLPELRGGCPSYIQAYFKMKSCSTTIHYMDDKWDHGDIVAQKNVDIDPGATYQDRMDRSAKVAAELLNEIHKNNFEFTPTEQMHEKATYCHKILKIKNNISRFSKEENFEGFVAANYYETTYPFTYTFYKGFIFSILKVKKMDQMAGYKYKGLFSLDGRYYVAFYGEIYLITLYIYKGNLISLSGEYLLENEDINFRNESEAA